MTALPTKFYECDPNANEINSVCIWYPDPNNPGYALPMTLGGSSSGSAGTNASVASDGTGQAAPSSATQLGYYNGTYFAGVAYNAPLPCQGGDTAGVIPTAAPVGVSGVDGTGKAQRMLLDAMGRTQTHDDTLATAQAGSGLKTIQTNPSPAIGAATIATANTAQQLPSLATPLGAVLQNQSASDVIYVGTSSAVSGASNGFRLAPGQPLTVTGANLNAYWFVGPSTGSVLGYAA